MSSRIHVQAQTEIAGCAIESLEPRRLFSTVINGTSGNDRIVVIEDPFMGTDVLVNGIEKDADGSSLVINCVDGKVNARTVRTVNVEAETLRAGTGDDVITVTNNWQATGRNFTQGDFNHDVRVDVTDLGSLATNWQQSISGASPATTSNFVTPATSKRVIDQIDTE
jgi:hypothetical protein